MSFKHLLPILIFGILYFFVQSGCKKEETLPEFNQIGPLYLTSIPPELPKVSINGVSGTWAPPEIRTDTAGILTYVFTPDAGQEAKTISMNIEVIKDFWALDSILIHDYIEQHQLNASRSPEGVYYIIEEPGSNEHPNLNSYLKVHYKGYLLNGTVFDETTGTPAQFYLSNTIRGWKVGIPLFGRGGKGTLIIPSDFAYGENSYTKIPSHSILVFDITLEDFQ
jgi:FKBP-type peptidyl-prolyl cis-trans isomerase FkpA